MMWYKKFTFLNLIFILFFNSAFALTFDLPQNGDSLVGKVKHITALPGDNFNKLGRRFDIGYYQLVEANPGVNPDRIEPGTRIIIPSSFILPATPREGIVINLAELRLYYYPADSRKVVTFPLGIGREGWNTPVGLTKITTRETNPTWYAPESIRAFRQKEGVYIPPVVPPGPDNPLGGYRMRLALPGNILIHGTNDASGVGRRSSSGCIRMLPEDVEQLFQWVKIGTPVRIINEPYKAGWHNGELYLEAHLPLEEQLPKYDKNLKPMTKVVNAATQSRSAEIDWRKASKIAYKQNGIPALIGEN